MLIADHKNMLTIDCEKTPEVGDFVTVDKNLIMSGYLIEIVGDEGIVEIDNHTGWRIDSFRLSDLCVVNDITLGGENED